MSPHEQEESRSRRWTRYEVHGLLHETIKELRLVFHILLKERDRQCCRPHIQHNLKGTFRQDSTPDEGFELVFISEQPVEGLKADHRKHLVLYRHSELRHVAQGQDTRVREAGCIVAGRGFRSGQALITLQGARDALAGQRTAGEGFGTWARSGLCEG